MQLILNHVTKHFDNRIVISNLSFSFSAKGLSVITGPSGCGKTTLLRMIAGLERPDSGTITRFERIAVSFQEYRLFPHLTALQNASAMAGRSGRQTALEASARMLQQLGFSQEQMHLYPAQLSGGMKQRVSLTRALCTPADLVLLDEPLKELDAHLKETAMQLIQTKSQMTSVIMTAHDFSQTASPLSAVLTLEQ